MQFTSLIPRRELDFVDRSLDKIFTLSIRYLILFLLFQSLFHMLNNLVLHWKKSLVVQDPEWIRLSKMDKNRLETVKSEQVLLPWLHTWIFTWTQILPKTQARSNFFLRVSLLMFIFIWSESFKSLLEIYVCITGISIQIKDVSAKW